MDKFQQYLEQNKHINPPLFEAMIAGYSLLAESARDISYSYIINKAVNKFRDKMHKIVERPEVSQDCYNYMRDNNAFGTSISGIGDGDVTISIWFDRSKLGSSDGLYDADTKTVYIAALQPFDQYEMEADEIIRNNPDEYDDYDEDDEEAYQKSMKHYYARLNTIIVDKAIADVRIPLHHELSHYLQWNATQKSYRLEYDTKHGYTDSADENDSRFHQKVTDLLLKYYSDFSGPAMNIVSKMYNDYVEEYHMYGAEVPTDLKARIADIVRNVKNAKQYLTSRGVDLSDPSEENIDKLLAYCYR